MIRGLVSSAREVSGSLRRNRRLVLDFVRRDLRVRYAGSSLGFFWAVVVPIVNLIVYTFVFQFILKARWGDTMTPLEVVLIMLTGIVVWTAFAETMQRCTYSMAENSNLIQKVVFPAEILPAFLSISSLVGMCFGLPIVLLAMTWIGGFSDTYSNQRALDLAAGKELGPLLSFGPGLALLPLLFVLQLLFSTGLGFILATTNVLVRDFSHLIGVITMVWMFATPIFYPAELLSKRSQEPGALGQVAGLVLELNPMYWLIDSYRQVLLYGRWPDWGLLGRFALVAIVVYAIGARVISVHKPRFPDLL